MEESDHTDPQAVVARAHAARDAHRYTEAHEAFAVAQQLGELSTGDVLAWGDAAWWTGRADEALRLAELGHRRLLDEGQTVRAAMEAINLGFLLMLRGEFAVGSGWLQRGRSLVERSADDLGRGYVLHLDAEEALAAGEAGRAARLARAASDIGRAGSDAALTSLALMTEGSARLREGAVTEAMALVDEAMLPVTAGELPPAFAGNLYCQMISLCWELGDLRRAREWTAATEQWCERFDSAVMFSGICRMHRVQLRHLAGQWDAAAAEAEVVCHELVGMNAAVVAEGHYLAGELLRLRGDADEAEAAYRRAHELGRDPQPGLALLRASSGQYDTALTSLQAALAAHGGAAYRRAPLLRAVVEIALACSQVEAARAAAGELADAAERWSTDGLHAAAAHAQGAVALAEGDTTAALAALREAVRRWRDLDVPYDGARARALLAEAYTAIGDQDAARLESGAAAATLSRLGAAAERIRGGAAPPGEPPGGLTPREAEVLALVAEGGTNRQVADRLVISERTVARHLANIFLKLGVSTRTAAAAWARRHGLARSA